MKKIKKLVNRISFDVTITDDKIAVDLESSTDTFGTLTSIAYLLHSIINSHKLNVQITLETLNDIVLDLQNYGKVIYDAKEYEELKSVPKSDVDEPVDDTFDQNWINQG